MQAAEADRARTQDAHGDRIETRTLEATTMLAGYLDWPGVAQACRIVSVVKAGGEEARAVSYAIASVPRVRAGAATLWAWHRGHWSVENPQSEGRRCDNLCVAGPARRHRRGGPARAGRAVRPASGPRRRSLLIEGPDRVPPPPVRPPARLTAVWTQLPPARRQKLQRLLADLLARTVTNGAARPREGRHDDRTA